MYTTDEVISKLQSLGISPKKSLGQNFLVSKNTISKILAAVESTAPQNLIEIGPGLGALTEGLIEQNKNLEVIELDKVFSQIWRDQGVVVHEIDALKWDWQQLKSKSDIVLVSNLPYQISSSIVIDRSVWPCNVKAMILMFQKEVGARMTGKAGTDDYGLISVIAQSFWDVSLVCDAGPKDFYPPPKIASRVLKFTYKPLYDEKKAEAYLKFVKQAFSQRRKMLVKNLKSMYAVERLESFLQENYDVKVRAEDLTPSDYQKFFDYIYT